jgi:3-oxoacid CoA-transferase subunit A
MDKIFESALAACYDIHDGARILVGGFGLCGIPECSIGVLSRRGVRRLTIISNNCGVDDFGLGLLLRNHQIASIIASYVGENKEFERQYLAGELELELCPQGTLAERIRAGGAGIPAFYTPTGVGTILSDGGLPLLMGTHGEGVLKVSTKKEVRDFDGRSYVLEPAITADFALVKAWRGDMNGNLIYRHTAMNFNPVMATAAKTTIAEVEEIVENGSIDPDHVHTPGIYVQRIYQGKDYEKRIERRKVRPSESTT